MFLIRLTSKNISLIMYHFGNLAVVALVAFPHNFSLSAYCYY